MSTIKIKRGTGSTAPATLVDGELAHAQGSNVLYIGSGASVVKVVDGGEAAITKALAETNEANITTNAASIVTTNGNVTTNTGAISTLDGEVVKTADTDASAFGFAIDEDTMVSDDSTKLPTQQSVKAYVDTKVAAAEAGAMSYEGNFNSATIGTGGLKGQVYEVAAAETFLGEVLEAGDTVTVKVDNPGTQASNYNFVNKNIDPTVFIASSDKGNANGVASLNADTEVVELPAGAAAASAGSLLSQDGSWVTPTTVPTASTTVAGIVELATNAEAIAGNLNDRIMTVSATVALLDAYVLDGGTF